MGCTCTGPEADLVKLSREEGGGDLPVQGGIKGCWAPDADDARETMHRLWPNDFIPRESARLLPSPRHFEQLTQLVTKDKITAPCGPDPQPHLDAIRAYAGGLRRCVPRPGRRLAGRCVRLLRNPTTPPRETALTARGPSLRCFFRDFAHFLTTFVGVMPQMSMREVRKESWWGWCGKAAAGGAAEK